VYPLSTGRNFDEILRVLDSLILYDTCKFATASKWKPGNDVFILGGVSDEEAKKVTYFYSSMVLMQCGLL
jgi:alkyl hydroperoxide reductase subunit AhpC